MRQPVEGDPFGQRFRQAVADRSGDVARRSTDPARRSDGRAACAASAAAACTDRDTRRRSQPSDRPARSRPTNSGPSRLYELLTQRLAVGVVDGGLQGAGGHELGQPRHRLGQAGRTSDLVGRRLVATGDRSCVISSGWPTPESSFGLGRQPLPQFDHCRQGLFGGTCGWAKPRRCPSASSRSRGHGGRRGFPPPPSRSPARRRSSRGRRT